MRKNYFPLDFLFVFMGFFFVFTSVQRAYITFQNNNNKF